LALSINANAGRRSRDTRILFNCCGNHTLHFKSSGILRPRLTEVAASFQVKGFRFAGFAISEREFGEVCHRPDDEPNPRLRPQL
jgi:hypothetical protein